MSIEELAEAARGFADALQKGVAIPAGDMSLKAAGAIVMTTGNGRGRIQLDYDPSQTSVSWHVWDGSNIYIGQSLRAAVQKYLDANRPDAIEPPQTVEAAQEVLNGAVATF